MIDVTPLTERVAKTLDEAEDVIGKLDQKTRMLIEALKTDVASRDAVIAEIKAREAELQRDLIEINKKYLALLDPEGEV